MLHSESNTIITGISFAEYWETYAEQGYEWVGEGMLKMPPIHKRHQRLLHYFILLFYSYFADRPVGEIQTTKFAMRFEYAGESRVREPDLMVVLNESLPRLHDTYLDGAADIVVEIVSADSGERDYRIKFSEYQAIGVQEYWIIDPDMGRAEFNVLDADGTYQRAKIDPSGFYRTALLPKLTIHVPTFWQDQLPGPREIIRQMDEPTP